MKYSKLSKVTFSLVILGILIIFTQIIIYSSFSNISNNPDTNLINNKTEFEMKNERSREFNAIYVSNNFQDGSCGECHEDFNPFDVEIEFSDEMEPNKEFGYEIIVSNTDSNTPHTVEDLEAKITGFGEDQMEPYNNEITNSVLRFQSNSHTFPIETTASQAVIILSGDEGVLGRNNIDMTITSPNSQTWSSTGSGTHEEITLNGNELDAGGTGEYSIEIQYISGISPISYSLTIEIYYVTLEFHQYGDDLNQGDSYTFIWRLVLTSEELDNLGSEVSGTIRYEHDGGHVESYRYIVEISADFIKQKYIGNPNNYLLDNGQIFGFITLFIFGFIIVNGFSKNMSVIISKNLKIKNSQNVHCMFALIIILFSVIHASLLILGPYTWYAVPNIYGTVALITFGSMIITGYYKNPIVVKIGNKNWKQLHRVLTFIVVLIIIYHMITFGGHFN